MAKQIKIFDCFENELSQNLILLDDDKLFCYCDCFPMLPLGTCIFGNKINQKFTDIVRDNLFDSNLIVGRDDLIRCNFYKLHEPPVFANGCCGPAGYEKNVFGPANQSLGFENADCYQTHFVELDKNLIVIKLISEADINDSNILIAYFTHTDGIDYIIERAVCLNQDCIRERLLLAAKQRIKNQITPDIINNEYNITSSDVNVINKFYNDFFFNIKICSLADNKNLINNLGDERLWLFTKYPYTGPFRK